MAMNRVITVTCDLCGKEDIPQDVVRVFRVGTVHDRPDGCVRFDVGPECYAELPRPLDHLIALYEKTVSDGQ